MKLTDDGRTRRVGFAVGVALGVGMRAMGVPPADGEPVLPGETLASYGRRLIARGPSVGQEERVDDTAQAIADLKTALKAGELKIITADLAPGAAPSPDPASYVQRAVVSLAPLPGHDGVWLATSAEGDATIGEPPALLRRLTRWSREPSPDAG